MLWQGACNFTAGMMYGLLYAPSLPSGRQWLVALLLCYLSIGEGKTLFRKASPSCQDLLGRRDNQLSPALRLPRMLSPFLLGRHLSRRMKQLHQFLPLRDSIRRNLQFPSRCAGLRFLRTRMAIWGPRPESASHDVDDLEGTPAWKGEETTEVAASPPSTSPSKGTSPCADVRFLVSSAGITHMATFHSSSRILCLACRSESCTFRCQPACGCFSDFSAASVLPVSARLCRHRACVIASAGDC